ncbi:hypothetical protein HK097_004344 [Rhizophlyctis rosea]|uniref:Bulb-type lectin domain-containing protein n=1 Tax=Rhizophlyctis rosea TaxID=64517 RepID=A0AAD5SJD4_9FUNG|nr:hypothetical protein HK097_004344 [Rhizophlyctis rosea]
MDMTDDNMLHSTENDEGDDDKMCPGHVMIQKDGNLVAFDKYAPGHPVYWASNTAYGPTVYPPHFLYLRENGDLEIVNGESDENGNYAPRLLWAVRNPDPHIEGNVYRAFVRCSDGALVLLNENTNQIYWTSNDEPWEAPHTSSMTHEMPMTSMTMSHSMTCGVTTVTSTITTPVPAGT